MQRFPPDVLVDACDGAEYESVILVVQLVARGDETRPTAPIGW